jgi:hypothetical protein
MTEEEQEALGDRYYLAYDWVARQGKLAGWLWAHDRAVEANRVLVAVTKMTLQWPKVMGLELLQSFFYTRYIEEKRLGLKSKALVPH